MKITTELYGDYFGDNNITKAFEEKAFKIRLDLTDDEHQWKHSFIIDREEAILLVHRINEALKEAEKIGFYVK